MDAISYKTSALRAVDIKKEWLLVDAKHKVLGRIATEIALRLRGKHKPSYSPHMDCGDHVIVINASQIRLTGRKWSKKKYIHHTGYPGGQKSILAKHLHEKHPTRILEKAVRGMLPKNRLGRQQFRHLYIYDTDTHPHEAQQAQPILTT